MNSNNLKDLYEGYSAVYDDNLRESLKFETWVNELLDEGYDLSDYTLDELYDVYEEREDGVKEYKPSPTQAEIRQSSKGKRTIPSRHKTGYGPDEKFTKPDDKIEKPGTTVPKPKEGGYGRISPAIPHGIGDHADKTQSRVSTIVRKDPGAPNSQKLPPEERKRLSREIVRKKTNEEVDLYDVILSHLLDEGYAETVENAESIMVNMSEDWRESICEGYKKFPYKKVEDKIHKKEADNPTGRGTPQSVKMDKVFRHFKGEVRRTERREHSPKISKSKEAENRARGVSDN